MKKTILNIALGASLMGLLPSCSKEEKVVSELRTIKTITIKHQATEQVRKFSGVVYAVNYSFLSFEDINGRVIKLKVDIGDEVKKGDIIAILDKKKYDLELKNGEANLKKAIAQVVKAKADYDREKILFKKQVSYQQQLDTKKFQYEAAISNKASAVANLGLAARNLKNTDLKAPFDGFISERMIQENQEVSKGEKIFRVDKKGAMEVQFNIPEGLRKRVTLGTKGVVKLTDGKEIVSKISYISSAATEGNAFPAKAILEKASSFAKSGMSAEISLTLPVEEKKKGFLVPVSVISLAKIANTGYVFIYDKSTSKVVKTKITFSGAQGNLGIISSGVKEGDIIASAGVSFLLDGMKVNLGKNSEKGGE